MFACILLDCLYIYMSLVTCQVSHVRCQVSHVTCQWPHKKITNWWSYLVEGLLSTGPIRTSLKVFTTTKFWFSYETGFCNFRVKLGKDQNKVPVSFIVWRIIIFKVVFALNYYLNLYFLILQIYCLNNCNII